MKMVADTVGGSFTARPLGPARSWSSSFTGTSWWRALKDPPTMSCGYGARLAFVVPCALRLVPCALRLVTYRILPCGAAAPVNEARR